MNKPIKILLALALAMSSFAAIAQPNNKSIALSYFGNNLWNEGLKLQLEQVRTQEEIKNWSDKSRTLVSSHAMSFGMFRDTDNFHALFVLGGWSKKRVLPNRFYWNSSFQPLGLTRTFLPGTYKVNVQGAVKRKFLAGRWYLSPAVAAGFGRQGKKRPNSGWFTRLNVLTLMPYNNAIMPLLNLEFGIQFSLSSPSNE